MIIDASFSTGVRLTLRSHITPCKENKYSGNATEKLPLQGYFEWQHKISSIRVMTVDRRAKITMCGCLKS